ncbi:MAG: hypothetical protein V1849_04355 [Chloroflexota bacterium]
MRRGCVSLGEVKCDGCGRTIPYPQRYLVIEEEDGKESEKGEPHRYCAECARKKGYAHYTVEKGEKVLSFFPQPES